MQNDREDDVKIISHFGSEVHFSPLYHYNREELEPYRLVGDVEMDTLIEYLAEQGGCGAFDDVIELCRGDYERYLLDSPEERLTDRSLAMDFYAHYHDIPPWVDWEQIQRGIDIFLTYLPASGSALYYRSLIGGFSIPKIVSVCRYIILLRFSFTEDVSTDHLFWHISMIANQVEVLIATRYLVPASMRCSTTVNRKDETNKECSNDDKKRTFERLMDTGGFMACCFAPLPNNHDSIPAASLRPGGKGWKAALRVRVLHAKVRRSLILSKSWDIRSNGVPINQEDMAATLLAFSVNVLLGIEYLADKPLSEDDQRDYLALWRYLGWLLGVDTPEELGTSNPSKGNILVPIDPCGPCKQSAVNQFVTRDPILHAYATLESMILHLLHPTKESRQLVHHLLSFNGHVHFRSEMCRNFLGDPLSDNLDVVNCSNHVTRILVYFFLVFLRLYTVLAMTFPRARWFMLGWHKSFYARFLVVWEEKHEQRVSFAMRGDKADDESIKKYCPFSMLMPPVRG